MARRLEVSRQHICDVEQGRRRVSPQKAAAWAEVLGESVTQYVRLAVQDQLDAAGLSLRVRLEKKRKAS